MLEQYQPIQVRALKKLDARETSALLGPLVGAISIASSQSDDDKYRWLHLVEESYRELLERLNRPLMFLGPNGERWTEAEWHGYVYDQLMGEDDRIPG